MVPHGDASLIVAVLIFVLTFALLISERAHRTTAAIAGAMAMIVVGIDGYGQDEAFAAIDLNVIFLLVGMMIIVNVLATTGVFQWLAVRSAKTARGRPTALLVLLGLVTAFASAFLDNVTTVILIAPVTLILANTLELKPAPLLIALAMASNLGGASTLVGDPPNILIASGAGISFPEFAAHMAPVSIVSLAGGMATLLFLMRKDLVASADAAERILELDDKGLIVAPALLRRGLAVLGLTIAGFLLHDALGLEPATVALSGAALILLLSDTDPHQVLRDVEWTTVLFFVGLFVIVGGVEQTGALADIAHGIRDISGGSETAMAFLLLWVSALLSGVVDNIPYTAALIPVVADLKEGVGGGNVLWWSLAIGADFGGNLTIVGASANVLVANLAVRGGSPIRFWDFVRYGVPVTLVTISISSLYIWVRYLL